MKKYIVLLLVALALVSCGKVEENEVDGELVPSEVEVLNSAVDTEVTDETVIDTEVEVIVNPGVDANLDDSNIEIK